MTYLSQLIERYGAKYGADKLGVRGGFIDEKDTTVEEELGQNGRLLVTAIANTNGVDLEDEVVLPSGADLAYFKANKSILWCHDAYQLPVGKYRNARLLPDKSAWEVQFSTCNTEFSRDCAVSIREGALRGTSIGFVRVVGGQPTEKEIGFFGPHSFITRLWNWLELSVTPMPCNPGALIQSAVSEKSKPELPEEAASAISRLVAKGKISRKSAELMGVKRRVIVVKPVHRIALTAV